jgi:hypothetical protein
MITNQPMHDENAWLAQNEREAKNLVGWLKDNGVTAQAVTLPEWTELQAKWRRDNA